MGPRTRAGMSRSPRTAPECGQERNEQENSCDDGDEQGSQRGGGTGYERVRESRNGWAWQEEQGGTREQRQTGEKTGPEGALEPGLPKRQRMHRPGTRDQD